MEKILSILFILNILISKTKSLIVIPFKTLHKDEPSEFLSPSDIITYWENNIIYSNVLIGTPNQNIVMFFHSQNFSSNMYYHMCDFPGSSFERKDSKTFSYVQALNRVYPMENASLVRDKFYFYDDLTIKQTKEYTIPFIYSDNEKEIQKDHYEKHDYTCMGVGLQMSHLVSHEPKSNFISQLKNEGIETCDLTLEYLTPDEGRIIIGEEPYIYDSHKSNKKYKVSGAINNKDLKSFFLNFDSVYMMKDKEQKIEIDSSSIKIIIDMGLILGPEDYRKNITELFFDKMKEKGKCNNIYTDSKHFYWCEKSAENDIKNNFPTLFFQMKQYFKVFELTYEDLFREKNGKLYFLIYFKNMNYNPYFEMGKILLKKYTFTFNQYNNHIGYYNSDIKLDGEEEEEIPQKSIWDQAYLWIIICVLIVVFVFLGYFIGKKVRDNARKRRINEVDDDNFDYTQPENEDKRLFNNDNNEKE